MHPFLQLVDNGHSEDRLKAFLKAIELHLGVKGSGLNTRRIAEGLDEDLLQSYLGQCMVAWQQTRGQRRDNQTLMTAVRATVKRLAVPGGEDVMSSYNLANTASQKQRSAEKIPHPVQTTPTLPVQATPTHPVQAAPTLPVQATPTLPVQATPTIPSISITPTIGDTPILMATPTKQRPTKISRSRSVVLPGQQVPRPSHNPGPGHKRGHSDASARSSKEVWSSNKEVWSLTSNGGNDLVLSGDNESEMDHLTSPLPSLMSRGSTVHLRVSPSERTRGDLSPLERTRGDLSPLERTRGDLFPSERTRGDLSPLERTRSDLSASERTRDVHSPSKRTRDRGDLSDSTKDRLAASPRNLDFHPHPDPPNLPKSQLGGPNMSGDHVPNPSNHSDHDSRTGVIFNDPTPTHHHSGLPSASITQQNQASDFSTLPERRKHREGEELLFPIARRTFSSPESLTACQAGEEDNMLATAPSKPSKCSASPLKRSQSQLGSAGSKINTSTISLDRPQRASSITQLDYASEVPSKMDDLHERVTMLAAVMNSEGQSLLKHLNDTGV